MLAGVDGVRSNKVPSQKICYGNFTDLKLRAFGEAEIKISDQFRYHKTCKLIWWSKLEYGETQILRVVANRTKVDDAPAFYDWTLHEHKLDVFDYVNNLTDWFDEEWRRFHQACTAYHHNDALNNTNETHHVLNETEHPVNKDWSLVPLEGCLNTSYDIRFGPD